MGIVLFTSQENKVLNRKYRRLI